MRSKDFSTWKKISDEIIKIISKHIWTRESYDENSTDVKFTYDFDYDENGIKENDELIQALTELFIEYTTI